MPMRERIDRLKQRMEAALPDTLWQRLFEAGRWQEQDRRLSYVPGLERAPVCSVEVAAQDTMKRGHHLKGYIFDEGQAERDALFYHLTHPRSELKPVRLRFDDPEGNAQLIRDLLEGTSNLRAPV